jgi:UPF0716 protein FxsA
MRRVLEVGLAIAIVEVIVIVEVAQQLGVVDTLGLLLLVSVVGTILVKAQGLAALRRLAADLQARRVPGPALADGALKVGAAVLLVIPGFLSDGAALLLFVPAVRHAVRGRVRRRWAERFVVVRGDELEA